MKVLWLCNIMLPRIAAALGRPATNLGGWLVGLSDDLLGCPDLDLVVCSPIFGAAASVSGEADGLKYWGFPQGRADIESYNQGLESEFRAILQREDPDVIHIFGTEYPHTLAMVKASESTGHLDRVVISIQGLVSVYARHYEASLPPSVVHGVTLKDVLKRSNIRQERKGFERRGRFEIAALQRVGHVIGRTDWDRACCLRIHPGLQYHFCNETLRSSFYGQAWRPEACERHTLFVSQSNYPIKGFHFLLEAMPDILARHPDARVYTTGTNPLASSGPLRMSAYQRHIRNLISRHRLEEQVVFLGDLDEQGMRDRLLRTHVFVSCSTIENSSNAIGEAALMGVPVVASHVGGTGSMLQDHLEALLYQHDAPYMLAHHVCEIFEHGELALQLSRAARARAGRTHDRAANLGRLREIYGQIGAGGGNAC